MSLFCPECHTRYDDDAMGVCPRDGVRLYTVDEADPLIGGVLDDRFRIDYALGVGGMGTVYGGVQLSVNRDVAIKVLRTELSGREVALERFFREAKTISKLSHPNIVKLIDFGQDRERDILYLAMELVRGQNLADLISRGRLRASLALEVAYQVCGALTEPHAENVIHRDLKPDNLLLVPVSDGTVQVKVLDFGIARFMESNTQLTGTGMICGTPAYMAPEQAQNETLDPRTDLYALGVVLYEMLSGWPPFSGTSSLQVMLKHIQESPPQLRDLLPPSTLPEAIEDLVYSMIAKDRTLRPASAREVRDRIEKMRDDFGLDRVVVATGRGEVDEKFEPFVLPKLPRPDKDKSGPTQVLRRETGLNVALGTNGGDRPFGYRGNDTAADPPIPVTGPLTPDGKLDVAQDALRLRQATRSGGQQGWTPGDQKAVRSIKDTKDVDAYGATVDGSALSSPRRTMVEADDSAPLVHLAPGTDDAIKPVRTDEMIPARMTAGATQETSERTSSHRVLTLIAVVCTLGAIAAAAFVGQKIDRALSAQAAVAPVVVDEPVEPVVPPPSSAPAPGVVAAMSRAQAEVRVAQRDGSRAQAATKGTAPQVATTTKPTPPTTSKARKPDAAKAEQVETPPKKRGIDSKIELLLDDRE